MLVKAISTALNKEKGNQYPEIICWQLQNKNETSEESKL